MEYNSNQKKYHDITLWDVQFHANKLTNPKGWYSQTLKAAMSPKETRAYTYDSKFYEDRNKKGRYILELDFIMSDQEIEVYDKALKGGEMIKIKYPKDGIRIHNSHGMIERLRAENKKIGFQYYEDLKECRARPCEPLAIDTANRKVTIKLELI